MVLTDQSVRAGQELCQVLCQFGGGVQEFGIDGEQAFAAAGRLGPASVGARHGAIVPVRR